MFMLLIAFFIGILVGWVWKPSFNFHSSAITQQLGNSAGFGSTNMPLMDHPSSSREEEEELVTDEDLKHLWLLVEKRDGGPPWKHMMERSTPTMTYQASQRDPQAGPPQYCTRTVYEDATPDLLRDFFWDDDFRLKWDDMLLHAATLQESPNTGTSVVHWIRRFPFFCSDREYTIGRRIWELDGSFYCITKGVSYPSIPRKQKPLRVDVYYSSWLIQSVKGNNQASEVIFFHHEDMGIPWEIAKFAERQGMWGTARKVEQGFRWYQKERACSTTISSHVAMAQRTTKIDGNYLSGLESDVERKEMVVHEEKKQGGLSIPKLLVIGGAVLLACSLHPGTFTKTLTFGAATRFGNIARRAFPS